MRRTVLAITAVTVIATCGVAYPQEKTNASPAANHYLAFWQSYFQGDWTVRVTEGETVGRIATGNEGTWSCQLAPTKACMLFSATMNGTADSNAIAGFDRVANAWKEVSFLANGGQLVHLYHAEPADLVGDPVGKVISGKAKFIHTDGKVENGDVTISILNRDSFEYVATDRRVGEQKLAILKATFKRTK